MNNKYIFCAVCAFLGALSFILTFSAVAPKTVHAQTSTAVDLVFSREIAPLQEFLFPGNNGIFSVPVVNNGTDPAHNVSVNFYANGTRQCRSVFDLEPAEERTVWCGFSADKVGDLNLEVAVDEFNTISETNEFNNSVTARFHVSLPSERPNIIVGDLEIEPGVVHTGDDIKLTSQLTNNSKFDTGRFSLNWYAGDEELTQCNASVENIASSESQSAECVISENTFTNEVVIKLIADQRNRIAEIDESNNSAQILIMPLPQQEVPFVINTTATAVPTVNPNVPQLVLSTTTAQEISFEGKASALLGGIEFERDTQLESHAWLNYIDSLRLNEPALDATTERALIDFVAYGVDDNTAKLGAGERAAVLFSYKIAFNKLPRTDNEFADVIRIASGRWPVELSLDAQNRAHSQFYKVYHRIAQMDQPNDNAAITIMAYGLKQQAKNRNLDSERQGIKTFEYYYGHKPQTTQEWNIMQAITYSGATQ